MADEIMAYCVKEKMQRPMKDAHEVVLKNGKHAMQGVCASCGTKMMKFVSMKKTMPAPLDAPSTDTPGAGAPSADMPGAGAPSTDTSGANAPNAA